MNPNEGVQNLIICKLKTVFGSFVKKRVTDQRLAEGSLVVQTTPMDSQELEEPAMMMMMNVTITMINSN